MELVWPALREAEKCIQILLRVVYNHLPSKEQLRDHYRHSTYVHQSRILPAISPMYFV